MNRRKEELDKELARLNALKKELKKELKSLPLLEVGKWYWISNKNVRYEDKDKTRVNALIFNNGEERSYGFNSVGAWTTFYYLIGNLDDIIRLATPQEVKQALIEEAKRRDHAYTEYDYNPIENELCGISKGRLESVFCDGHWEQPVDKFAELKESHRNGAVIQFYNNFLKTWSDVYQNKPTWDKQEQYRIKPDFEVKDEHNCLSSCLNQWSRDNSLVLYYNSDHVIALMPYDDAPDGYLTLNKFGGDHLISSFGEMLSDSDRVNLIKYLSCNA